MFPLLRFTQKILAGGLLRNGVRFLCPVLLLLILAAPLNYALADASFTTDSLTRYEAKSLQAASLYAKARSEGSVRLIFQFDASTTSLQTADEDPVELRRRAIREGGEAVLQDLPLRSREGVKRFEYIPFSALSADESVLDTLTNDPRVVSIEEDGLARPSLESSVPLIGGDTARDLGYTGKNFTVAVLDTGVASNHPFLKDKVLAEACFSSRDSTWGITSLCPNGKSSQVGSGAGENCSTRYDGCGHGTHVAGIAAGNTGGLYGVAPDANLISIQVFSLIENDVLCDGDSQCISATYSDIILGLEQVYKWRDSYNVAAVNLSLGGEAYADHCDGRYHSTKAIMDLLHNAGIAVVVASGNESHNAAISYPACVSTAVAVGASTDADQVASYSNIADTVDLLAPGSSIRSSVPSGGYQTWDGTSMAAPHVAGALAVLREKAPDASVDELVNALKDSGKPLKRGFSSVSVPRIRVDDALDLLEASAGGSSLSASGIWVSEDESLKFYLQKYASGSAVMVILYGDTLNLFLDSDYGDGFSVSSDIFGQAAEVRLELTDDEQGVLSWVAAGTALVSNVSLKYRESSTTLAGVPQNGIWQDAEGATKCYVQAYETGSCLMVVMTGGVLHAFLDPDVSDGLDLDNSLLNSGCILGWISYATGAGAIMGVCDGGVILGSVSLAYETSL